MTETALYTGSVTALAFGGQGIIRHEGLVIFVPFTAIGDTISCRILQRKKNHAFAKLVEIITPSPQRITPPCPYYGTCGGCQLQHINYAAQLESKRQWIEDALKRQAGIADAVIPLVISTTQQWNYRRRIVLTLRPDKGHYAVGYVGVDHASLVVVNHCPIFNQATDPILLIVQEIAKKLAFLDSSEGRVTILKHGDTQYLLHFHFRTMPKRTDEIIKRALENHPEIVGIMATSPKMSFRHGQFSHTFEIDSLHFEFSPQAFIQSHPEQSLNIYREICKQAEKSKPNTILDLYCGIGISSLLLAKQGGTVFGVEANGEAVKFATTNAAKNALHQVSFVQAYVEEVLEALLKEKKPDLVLLNPPREGLSTVVMKQLLAKPPAMLIYISCMPATLARDLKPLIQAGYRLEFVQGYDMFPQTAHVETLVVLKHR